MVEVPGKGEDTRTADAPVSGFHAHDAAAESRPAYGSARVGPHRAEGKTCCHRRPRTAARPAGVNLRVPGVAGGLEVRSQRGRTSRELVSGQLPEKQPSGLLQVRNGGAVLLGNVILTQLRTAGRPARFVDVFDSNRNAMQWPVIDAGADVRFSLPGCGQHLFGENGIVGMNLGVELGDAVQSCLSQLNR